MNKLKFPLLNADDIEVRIGNFNKTKTKCTLLLYKTARVDANILDNTVGPFNWQKKFYELKGVIYCSLGIYYEDRNEWIWKDDAGAETQVENEKGQASDAFKRAAFAFGLGRELYTAPTIWIDNPENYSDFAVEYISYDEKNKIKDLVICAKDKTKNFEKVQLYPKGKFVAEKGEKAPKNENQRYINTEDIKVGDTFSDLSQEKGSITQEQKDMLNVYVSGLTSVSHDRFFVKLEENYGVGNIDFLSEHQANEILSKMKR